MCGIFIPRCEAETSRQSLRSASCISASFQVVLESETKNFSKQNRSPMMAKDRSGVRQHLFRLQHVRLAYQRQLLQLAHAAWSFRAQDVALARVRTNDLAARRHLKSLCGAAVGFQLQLWFRSISWHF
jgi:hypothetical protein